MPRVSWKHPRRQKQYTVQIERTAHFTGVIDVEADSEEAAEHIVVDLIKSAEESGAPMLDPLGAYEVDWDEDENTYEYLGCTSESAVTKDKP